MIEAVSDIRLSPDAEAALTVVDVLAEQAAKEAGYVEGGGPAAAAAQTLIACLLLALATGVLILISQVGSLGPLSLLLLVPAELAAVGLFKLLVKTADRPTEAGKVAAAAFHHGGHVQGLLAIVLDVASGPAEFERWVAEQEKRPSWWRADWPPVASASDVGVALFRLRGALLRLTFYQKPSAAGPRLLNKAAGD